MLFRSLHLAHVVISDARGRARNAVRGQKAGHLRGHVFGERGDVLLRGHQQGHGIDVDALAAGRREVSVEIDLGRAVVGVEGLRRRPIARSLRDVHCGGAAAGARGGRDLLHRGRARAGLHGGHGGSGRNDHGKTPGVENARGART